VDPIVQAASPRNSRDIERGSLEAPGASEAAVLVVIPSMNEADHITKVTLDLLRDAGRLKLRIVVADGGSTDSTCEIVDGLARRDSRVALLNARKRIAASINEAVACYGDDAEFLIRIDAHAEYPSHYCARLLAVQAETGADSVVVSMITKGHTCFQRAAAAAQNSILGNGGAAHRNQPRGQWVDHGHHALMRIAAYKRVGGYDEGFFWNEDAELDARLRAAGSRIYLAGGFSIEYFPRASVSALFRQYRNYGRGRALNFIKHREQLRLRQILPLAVIPAVAIAALAPFWIGSAVPALTWIAVSLIYGVLLGIAEQNICAAASGAAALVMHIGWSFGFFDALVTNWASALRRQQDDE
jgi:succinoglycan biosynthesis protein ExoA